MWSVITEALRILNEAAPYLLIGYFAAGLLSVILSRFQRINALLTTGGNRPVFLASLLGVPMPLCSCSVLPAALALRKQGASKGTTASFLISVPETDVISIILTYALLGPLLAVFRPFAALATALVTGLVVNRVDRSGRRPVSVAAEAAGGGGCCHCGTAVENESATPAETAGNSTVVTAGNAAADNPLSGDAQKGNWLVRALRFGFVEMFDDIMLQLLVGILLAGAVVALLPDIDLAHTVGNSPWAYLIMLGVGIPVYVCATVSTPLAVGLIAGGVGPGAALVFLLAGPATNIASLVVLNSQFGRRVLVAYLASIAVVSVLMGVWLDHIVGADFRAGLVKAGPFMHGHAGIVEIASSVLILVLAAFSFHRKRLVERWFRALFRRRKRA